MKKISSIAIIVIIILLSACDNVEKKVRNESNGQKNLDSIGLLAGHAISNKDQDSTELTGLIRKMYKWHENTFKNQSDFSPQAHSTSDSLYRSIDWVATNEIIKKLKYSGFFSQDFLDTYKEIALYIDKKLKDGTAKWPDGELPSFPGYNADPWCNCQDYPTDNWDWNQVIVNDIRISKGNASFIWNGGKDFNYKVKAKKEEGYWKISELEGFNLKNYLVEN